MAHLWPNQVTRITSNFQKDMRKEGNKMIFHLNTIFLKNNKQTNKWFHIHFRLFYLLNLIMPWLSRKPSKTDELYFLCVINVWHFFFPFLQPFFWWRCTFWSSKRLQDIMFLSIWHWSYRKGYSFRKGKLVWFKC